MLNLPLLNFILYNFNQAAVPGALIIHCWDTPVLRTYADLAASHVFYTQYAETHQIQRDFDVEFKDRFFKHKFPLLGVFLDMNCPHAEEILRAASSYRVFTNNFHWIVYDDRADMTRFRNLFDKFNVTVETELTYAVMDALRLGVRKGNESSGSVFTLYDVYNNGPHIGGKLNVTADRRISCSNTDCEIERYLTELYKRSKFGNRDSQRDVSIRLAVVVTHPPITTPSSGKLEFLRSEKNPNIDAICRFGFHQMDILRDMLQTNYNYTFHNVWSMTELSGGAVGAMIEEKAEITTSPLAVSSNRLKYLVPLTETGIFHSICMFRTPPRSGLGNSGQVFLEPFSSTVWIVFVVLLLVTAIQLWAIFFVEHYRIIQTSGHTPSLLTSCLITFGTACSQGSYILPGSTSGRISYSALVLASFIMYNYYTSIIVSSLLGSPVKSDIVTLGQLADSSLEVAFEPIPFHFAFLNTSQTPSVRRLVQRKIQKRKNQHQVWMSAEEGVLRVRDRKGFVYGFEASTGYAIVEKYYKPEEICDLNEILLRPERSLSNQMMKNSSFVELFRLRFLRMMETGVNRRVLKHWLRNQLHCMFSSSFVDVGFEYTAPLFVMLLVSFIFCVLLLLMEILWHTYGKVKFQNYVRGLKNMCSD